MRFRTPELFLGAFLAVAIFSMGMLFASSFTLQIQNAAPHQTGEYQAANKISDNDNKTQSLWVPIDSVGLYTLVLAIFTGLLVGVSGVQGMFLLRADKTARIAANAADLSARAAIALELPIIRAVRDRFSYGLSLDGEADSPRIDWCVITNLKFSNVGRTQAFPIELRGGWTVGDKLPDVPAYTFTKLFPINFICEPKDDEPDRMNINDCDLQFGPGLYDQVRSNTVSLWFYCSIVYLDFMQTRHEAGFCWQRHEITGGGVFLPDATPAYNQKT
jgi:hypothetical protein